MPPLLLEKAGGAALYATTDLATIGQRTGGMGAQRITYAVDPRQSLHFEQVFRAARKAGIDRGAALVHVGFGTVNGKDGKPYRTRQGGVARLSELIGEAVAKAEARVDESERLAAFPSAERQALSRAVGVAAVKFADLSGDRLSGYVFDVDRLVSFEGRTGPYLQYACVRIRSILGMAGQQDAAPGAIDPRHDAERDLLLACLRFPEAVSASAAALQPGVLADYAFGVAQRFSRFYAACPVLGADEPATRGSRLSLCRLAGRILERSLHLLGIEVPERM